MCLKLKENFIHCFCYVFCNHIFLDTSWFLLVNIKYYSGDLGWAFFDSKHKIWSVGVIHVLPCVVLFTRSLYIIIYWLTNLYWHLLFVIVFFVYLTHCFSCIHVLRNKPDFRCKPWQSISSSAKDFVKKLLIKDPRARLTAAQALYMCLFFIYLFWNWCWLF